MSSIILPARYASRSIDFMKIVNIEILSSLSKFCGRTIAGISLLSASVMRLKLDGKPDDLPIDILLEPRSLYIMK